MKYKLQEVAVISSGHTIRGRVDNDPQGDCVLFQMRDLNWDEMTLGDTGHKISLEHLPQNQILQPGDVLLLAKGSTNGAFVYRKEYIAAATSVFLVLRVNQERVLPEFLAWYLNQESTRRELQAAKGVAVIQNLTKNIIENLEIKLPSLHTQQKLVNLFLLWQVEKNQTINLIKMKDIYFNNLALAEIEYPREPEPFTDDSRLWLGYEFSGLYHFARIKLHEGIFLKKSSMPEREILVIIIEMKQHDRIINFPDGAFRGYRAVKEWHVIRPIDLAMWNDGAVPLEQKEAEILNVIPHSLIESITMVDRFGNDVEPINPWKR